jgi:menaquinone-9 beta-reductase
LFKASVQETHDVAIVGAGPAGSTLAILLARAGYDVVILEKARFPRDKVCGDLVSPRALKLIEALGCGDALRGLNPQPVRTAEVVLDGEILSETEIPDVDDMPGVCCVIPREQLDDVMFRAACSSGAVSVEGCRVLGFRQDGSSICIDAEVEGRPNTFRARLIVGADGAQSVVARAAGLTTKDPRYTVSSMRGYLSGLPLEKATFFFSSESFPGYAWVFPMRGGRANYGAGVIAEASTRDGIRVRDFLTAVRTMIEQRARAEGGEVSFGPTVGWPIKTFRADVERIFERGLLIGEAGGFVNPINGEGIALGIETSGLAAEVIEDALRTDDTSRNGLRGYEERWRAHFEADLRVGDMLVSLIRNRHLRDLWLGWFRAVNARARNDRDFAALANGVLAGAIPNRFLFAPNVIARALLQGPTVWSALLGRDPNVPETPLWDSLFRLGLGELDRMAGAARDGEWLAGWMDDIARKQAGTLRALLRRSRSY